MPRNCSYLFSWPASHERRASQNPDDPRTFPLAPSPEEIYFYRRNKALQAMEYNNRSLTDVTLPVLSITSMGIMADQSSVITSPSYPWRPEGTL